MLCCSILISVARQNDIIWTGKVLSDTLMWDTWRVLLFHGHSLFTFSVCQIWLPWRWLNFSQKHKLKTSCYSFIPVECHLSNVSETKHELASILQVVTLSRSFNDFWCFVKNVQLMQDPRQPKFAACSAQPEKHCHVLFAQWSLRNVFLHAGAWERLALNMSMTEYERRKQLKSIKNKINEFSLSITLKKNCIFLFRYIADSSKIQCKTRTYCRCLSLLCAFSSLFDTSSFTRLTEVMGTRLYWCLKPQVTCGYCEGSMFLSYFGILDESL